MEPVENRYGPLDNEPVENRYGPLGAVGHVVYLHGFTSSPSSSKARRFARELAARGVGTTVPDFNLPAFETLTVTRMLGQAASAIASAPAVPVALIGSSLGAFVAVQAAVRDRTARVDRLILLAPALDFGGNRMRELGDRGLEEWRATGRLRVFHHALNQHRDVGFGLYEDAAGYSALDLQLERPALVFQGTRDASVDPEMVSRWARGRSDVDLRLLDDGHQLTDSLDLIWAASEAFLGLGPARPA
jgi:pimeloyl-ACP methyl ester carboxylesterase